MYNVHCVLMQMISTENNGSVVFEKRQTEANERFKTTMV